MGLPVLNTHIKHKMKIPSTGQTVEYRPYLVKEERVLMQVMETGDKSEMLNNLGATIEACLFDDSIDTDKLTTFDIEYMFMKIRAKSVGDVAEIAINCTDKECDGVSNIEINLEEIQPPKVEVKLPYFIDLTEKKVNKKTGNVNADYVGIELGFPSYKSLQKLIGMATNNTSEVAASFEMIKSCLVAILDHENRYIAADYSEEEIDSFIGGFTTIQFKMIQDFINMIPELTHDISWDCDKCGEPQTVTLRGTADFFQ